MKLDVLSIEGKSTGRKINLPKNIFGLDPNDHAIYLAVKQFLANNRQGTHKTKERGEVKGSTRKIKKQKGTGTARAGSIRNPLFRGGGRTFGPSPRDYTQKLNKKVKRLARASAYSSKALDNNIIIVEDFTFDKPKTQEFVRVLENLNVEKNKTVFVTADYDENLILSSRNLKSSGVVNAKDLNTYEIMNAQKLLLTESSIDKIKETFA